MIYISPGGKGIGGILTVNAENGSIISISQEDVVKSQIANNGKVIFKGITSGFWNLESHLNDKFYEKQIEININKVVTVNYFEATINVTFPVDCTSVTCSKGDKSYSVPSGSLASGSYTFNVFETGEWVLACTNGTDSDTATVNVTESKAYSAELTFELVLFDNGEYAEETGGWTSITQNKLKLNHTDSDPYEESYRDLTTKNAIDLSQYNTLNFHIVSAYNRYYVGVGTSNSKANNSPNMTASKELTEDKQITDEIISIDISKINSAYIKLCVASYHSRSCNIEVDKVWVVK